MLTIKHQWSLRVYARSQGVFRGTKLSAAPSCALVLLAGLFVSMVPSTPPSFAAPLASNNLTAAPPAAASSLTQAVAAPPHSIPWDTNKQGGFILSMCMDRQGQLWVGTEDFGVWRYVPHTQQWTQFTTKNGLGDDNGYGLACDRLGRVWVGHLNHGLSVFNGKEWKNYDVVNGPLGSRVFAIATCPADGDVWIATEAGLSRYSLQRKTWSYFTRAEGLPSDQANAIAFDKAGNIFVGTQCDGISMASSADGYKTWRTVTGPDQMPNTPGGKGLPTNLINCLLVSPTTGTVYAGTTTGLARSEDDGKTWRFLRGADWKDKVLGLYQGPKPQDVDTRGHILLEDYITALAEDGAGHLWVGYRQKGMEVLDQGTGASLFQFKDDYVTSILPLPGLLPVVGHYGNGVGQAAAMAGDAGKRTTGTGNVQLTDRGETPSFPAAAKPPTIAEMQAMLKRVQALPNVEAEPAYVGEDWNTEGDWIGSYGQQYAVLWAGHAPLNDYIHSDLSYTAKAKLGPQHQTGDSVRHWIHWLTTDDTRVLWNPVEGVRRESEIDDHGETYPLTHDGPSLWLTVQVPEGTHAISLYFFNKDGHKDVNRWRDYVISVRPYAASLEEAESLPALARSRVLNFWGGAYKKFILPGSNKYYFQIARNWSENTVLPAIFMDRLSPGPSTSHRMSSPWLTPYSHQSLGGKTPAKLDLPVTTTLQPATREAVALWNALDSPRGWNSGSTLQQQYRVFAYRTLIYSDELSTTAGIWKLRLGLRTTTDRAQFLAAAQRVRSSIQWLRPLPAPKGGPAK